MSSRCGSRWKGRNTIPVPQTDRLVMLAKVSIAWKASPLLPQDPGFRHRDEEEHACSPPLSFPRKRESMAASISRMDPRFRGDDEREGDSRSPRCLFPTQETGDADVLVQIGPVDALAVAEQLPVLQLRPRRSCETRKPRQQHGKQPTSSAHSKPDAMPGLVELLLPVITILQPPCQLLACSTGMRQGSHFSRCQNESCRIPHHIVHNDPPVPHDFVSRFSKRDRRALTERLDLDAHEAPASLIICNNIYSPSIARGRHDIPAHA